MRIGGNIAPYRLPCGSGGTETYWLGSPYQHYRPGDTAEVYHFNVSVNTAAGCPAVSGNHPPCELYVDEAPSGCTTYASGQYGQWIGTGVYQYSLVAGQVNTAPDTWQDQGATISFALCRKAGFKNAAAQRYWHGCFAWTSHDPGGYADTLCPAGSAGYAEGGSFETYQANPDQTKYTVLTISGSLDHAVIGDGGLGTDQACTIGGAVAVNPLSGEITSTLSSTEVDTYHLGGGGTAELLNIAGGSGTSLDLTYGVTRNVVQQSAIIDGISLDLHNGAYPAAPQYPLYGGGGTGLDGIIADWNASFGDNQLPLITDVNSYAGSQNYTAEEEPGINHIVTIDLSFSRSATVVSYSVAYHNYFAAAPDWSEADDGPVYPNRVDYTLAYTATLSVPNTAATVYADGQSLLNSWPLNDDTLYPWRTDGFLQVAPLMTRNEVGATSPCVFCPASINDLSSPATDLNGNAPYTSGDPGAAAPYVYSATNHDSNGIASGADGYGGPATWVPTWAQIPFKALVGQPGGVWQWPFHTTSYHGGDTTGVIASGPLIQMYDGAVLGAPKPAGYQNPFCWQFEDWHGCHFDDGGGVVGFSFWRYGYGLTPGQYNASTGAQLPLNATQWTNNVFSIGIPPGASLMYADPTDINICDNCHTESGHCPSPAGGLILYKYAEIKEPWPSQNFARPAGADKFAYDETQVGCVSGLSGSGSGATFTSVDNTGTAVTLTPVAGSIWGGPSVGGFYDITVSGSTVTLGTLKYHVPSGWASASADDDSCFGCLRWTNNSATVPSIMGRAAVAYAGTTATFAAAQPAFGMAAAGTESVNLYDATMTLVASGVTATRIDDLHFSTGASYPTAVWATIAGAPAYQYNDNYAKGDYLALQWIYDRRTNAEFSRLTGVVACDGSPAAGPAADWPPGGPFTQPNSGYASFTQTPACLPFQPCCPGVICFSPNNETWTNGHTYPFPGTFALDERYGSRWQGFVQQTMTDLYWQTPHIPCGFMGAWVQNNGTCQVGDDATQYYPHAPQVEARASVPSGFPGLPSGLQIGWLDPTTHAPGAGVFDPTAYLFLGFNCENGRPAGWFSPWQLRINLCANLGCNGYGAQNPPC